MPGNKRLRIYLRLLSYVRPYIPAFLISIFGYILFAISMPSFAKLIEIFVEGLQNGDDRYLYYVPLMAVAIALVRGSGYYLGKYFLAKVSLGITHDLRVELFNKLINLPNRYFDNNNSGHLISRITYNVTLVTTAAADSATTVIREGLTVLFLLTYLLWTNWKLTLVLLPVMIIMAIIISHVGDRLRSLSHKIQDAMGQLTHVTSEAINGSKVVRSYGGAEYEKKRFLGISSTNSQQNIKLARICAINTPALQFLVIIAIAIVMLFVLQMQATGTVAELVAYVIAASMMTKPIRQLSDVYGNIQKGIAACENIFAQIDEQEEEDFGTKDVDRVKGKIRLSKLEFSYPDSNQKILKGIDLEIEPGETVAFVGRSGSGKTTITNLILRFYKPTAGKILIDDIPIQDYRIINLRQQIALVSQHTTLFNDTVANNIAYGALNKKDQAEIIKAAENANAMEFIRHMEQGLNTHIGEDGMQLSGGQRQRLAIARAFLKDAPILILDEATSALDSESENSIQYTLKRLTRGRTTLIVAHRISTIVGADKIVVLSDGNIVECGRHDELLQLDGEYATLYQNQLRSAPVDAIAD